MKKTLCKVRAGLISVLFVIALCMGALAIFTMQPVKAEAPVYEVTEFRNSNTKGNANSFYVLATYADALERKWEISYKGTGYLNGVAKEVEFRLIPGTGENGYFNGIGATKAGDVLLVGGVFEIKSVDPDKTNVQVGGLYLESRTNEIYLFRQYGLDKS